MNKKIRTAVLVSGNGTNLQALINAQKNKIIKSGKIELVISNNSNAFALKRAEKSKIPFEIISKKECKKIEEFERKLKEILNDNFKKEILSGIIHDIDSKKRLIYTSNIRVSYDFSEKYLEKIGFSWKNIDREYILKYMNYFKGIGFIEY